MATEVEKDPHFGKVFWFVVYITTVVFAYVFAVTFGHVPKENMRFVDIAFGFLLGTVLGTAIAYLLGGNPDKKTSTSQPKTLEEISATVTRTTGTTDNP